MGWPEEQSAEQLGLLWINDEKHIHTSALINIIPKTYRLTLNWELF